MTTKHQLVMFFASLAVGLCPELALADELNPADTAWILTASGLVLFMTVPGLALFYGGLVRTKNVLSILMQCFAITSLVSILWMIAGYSLALSDGGTWQNWLGGDSRVLLLSLNADTLKDNLPETVFCIYHLTFAIFAPALIVGGILWVAWHGFSAGSALMANGAAGGRHADDAYERRLRSAGLDGHRVGAIRQAQRFRAYHRHGGGAGHDRPSGRLCQPTGRGSHRSGRRGAVLFHLALDQT